MPEGWAWCRLGNLISIKSGDAIKVRQNQKGRIPVYGGNGITGYCSEYNIETPTIIIGRVGFNCGSVHLSEEKAWVTDNAFITTFNHEVLNINFLSQLLIFLNLRNYSNSTAQPVISGKTIYPILFPLPPYSEQERIVQTINEAFCKIDFLEDNQNDLQNAIKQTKNKILDLAIHGKLVPQDPKDEPAEELLKRIATSDNRPYEKLEEEPFEIPASWCWTKLETLGQTNIGLTYHPEDVSNEGIIVLRSNNINNDTLTFDDVVKVQLSTKILENQYIDNGDILICARNGSQNLVGKCTLISGLKEKTSFGAFMAVFRSQFNPYIQRYLQSKYFKDYMFESNSTQIHQLTQSMLKEALIPIPPEAEQKKIVEKINQLYILLDQIQNDLI